MKRLLKTNMGYLRVVFALVLCACIIVVFSKCEEEKCKTCTNTQTQEKRFVCDDVLREAEKMSHMSCE